MHTSNAWKAAAALVLHLLLASVFLIFETSCGTAPAPAQTSSTPPPVAPPTTPDPPSSPSPTPPPPPTPTPPPSPAPPPANSVQITSPKDGSQLASPFEFTFDWTGTYDHLNLYADGASIFRTSTPSLPASIFLPNGPHNLVLTAYDANGNAITQSTENVTVTDQTSPTSITNIQNMIGWAWCTAELNGHACASGRGNATSAMNSNQPQPSLSGSSAKFDIGGPSGYSNALWWKSLGGGTLLKVSTYSMDFYITDGKLPEALEFDVNQSFGGVRYTWGTECSYKDSKKWDVWDPSTLVWVATKVPCKPLSSQAWHHLEWKFERVNDQVHYISITLDGKTTPVDMYFDPQQGWNQEDLDIAFQMDGDFRQDPYSVWLDNVTLTTSY